MGLLDLIEEHHRERLAAHLLGQLTALVVTHVPGRRTEKSRHGVLLLVFGHIQGNQGVFIAEEEFCQSLRELGLTNTGWTSEDKRATGAARILQTGTGAANRTGESLDSVILTDHALVQLVLHLDQTRGLFLGDLVHRNTG